MHRQLVLLIGVLGAYRDVEHIAVDLRAAPVDNEVVDMPTYDLTQTRELLNLVDGQWLAGTGDELYSLDPARPDRVVARYRPADEDLLKQAIAAATGAQRGWAGIGVIARGLVLRRAAALLQERLEEFAALMCAEQGKTLGEARGEVALSAETLYYHAGQARSADGATFPSSNPDEVIRTVRRPVGTVAVITPWNFPLQIPVWKIAPALLHGNTVIWKPASETPAMASAFTQLLVEAGLPDGVLNLLLAPGSLGAALVADPGVDAVTFTGSVPVGRSIAAAATPRGAKVQLELGGHNAALVMDDVDLAAAADAVVAGAMGSTGQKCTATRRVIVADAVYEQFLPLLAERVRALQVGVGDDPATTIGPLVSARACQDVAAAVEQACREGAQVLATAEIPTGPGCWSAPTLLAGTPDMAIASEEVFGPVTTVLRAADLDEAIALANATSFGLTAAVFTTDEATARRCVAELDAGLVKVNGPTTGSELHAPFGGLKDSSFPAPREQNAGTAADFFTWTTTAYLRTANRRSN
ncbi:MAG: aldehyde dehydrogenase family protein [Actinomycetota bacterium]|nr:aldehyde dehydrogenase family protein [Actinomycetota bacterium]